MEILRGIIDDGDKKGISKELEHTGELTIDSFKKIIKKVVQDRYERSLVIQTPTKSKNIVTGAIGATVNVIEMMSLDSDFTKIFNMRSALRRNKKGFNSNLRPKDN